MCSQICPYINFSQEKLIDIYIYIYFIDMIVF